MPQPTRFWLKRWALNSKCVSAKSASCDKSANALAKVTNWGNYKPQNKGVSGWTCRYKGAIFNHCIFWAQWDGGEKVYIDATARQFGVLLPWVLVGSQQYIKENLDKWGYKTSEVKHISDTGSDSGVHAMYMDMFEVEREGEWDSGESDQEAHHDTHIMKTLRKSFDHEGMY